jgi:carbonic anhydrase
MSAADEALAGLLAGNERFAEGAPARDGIDPARRAEIASEQRPHSAVLACSDSRVPPEIVFDQGLGHLFTIRVAGNTATDPAVLGSIAFAASGLGVPLLVVLGHRGCGAVAAAAQAIATDARAGASGAVAPIIPVVEQLARSDPDASHDALAERAVRANVEATVNAIAKSPELAELVGREDLRLVGAEYDLESGRVEVL